MTREILVGFDGSPHAHDALALGELLARPLEAELTVACVYVFRPIHREGDDELEASSAARHGLGAGAVSIDGPGDPRAPVGGRAKPVAGRGG